MINGKNIIVVLLIALIAYMLALVYTNIWVGNEMKNVDTVKDVLLFTLGLVGGAMGSKKSK